MLMAKECNGDVILPKVSVVMAVYNAAEGLLNRALESVFAQTEQSFEIILVDDGSSNGCIECINEQFKSDVRLHIIRQANKGLQGALDRAIKECSGEYFYFVAQDDYAHPQTLEYGLHVLASEGAELCVFYENRQYEIATPQCSLIDDFDAIPRSVYSYGNTPDPDFALGLERLNIDIWGHFVKTTLVRKVHSIWPLYDSVARVHYMLTMAKRWVRSSAQLYYYNTVNPDSISKKAVTSVYIDRVFFDLYALYELYVVSKKSFLIWSAVRRIFVVRGVKMIVNAFRRHNKKCAADINEKCYSALNRMLSKFFACGMLPCTEVNLRMYLYYRWIILRCRMKSFRRNATASDDFIPNMDVFLLDYGCIRSGEGMSKDENQE